MVSNKTILKTVLFYCKIILPVWATSKNYSDHSYHGNQLSIINITNVLNINNVASLPVKLEVNEEINIELIRNEPGDNIEFFDDDTLASHNHTIVRDHPENRTYGVANFDRKTSPLKYQNSNKTTNPILATNYQGSSDRQSQNKTTTTSCCLVIYPPKCDLTQCTIRRKKICWNVCTEEIVILEAPGFPKDQFPREFIPPDWKNVQFIENITISLIQPDSTGYQGNSLSGDKQYQQSTYSLPPYPYVSPQNLPSPQYQNINPNNLNNMQMAYQTSYPYFSPYHFEPRPHVYWCPGPYCPLLLRPSY